MYESTTAEYNRSESPHHACKCAGETGLGSDTAMGDVGLSSTDGDFALIGLSGLPGRSMEGDRALTGSGWKGSSSCSTTKPNPDLLGEAGM